MICEISTSLIQPLLTIVGWAVMILWAIKQIKLSSTTNLSIQKELLEENHRRELVKEIIHIYKDLVISLEDLLQAGNIFSLHLNLENADIKSNVSITASGLNYRVRSTEL